jgi:hypothetical protein
MTEVLGAKCVSQELLGAKCISQKCWVQDVYHGTRGIRIR